MNGSYGRERHGHNKVGSRSRAYSIWASMKSRCLNPKVSCFPRYGGRGIGVCGEWMLFSKFLADMGEPPEGMQLDRIDNTKGYSKSNCRWATLKENQRNTRRSKYLEFRGESKTLAEWIEITGMGTTLPSRLNRGWTVDEAITIPVGAYSNLQRGFANKSRREQADNS